MGLYYELPVYKKTNDFILRVFEITKFFDKEYKYTLLQEMKKEAISLVRNIYRANISYNKKQYLQSILDNFKNNREYELIDFDDGAGLFKKNIIKKGNEKLSLNLYEFYDIISNITKGKYGFGHEIEYISDKSGVFYEDINTGITISMHKYMNYMLIYLQFIFYEMISLKIISQKHIKKLKITLNNINLLNI